MCRSGPAMCRSGPAMCRLMILSMCLFIRGQQCGGWGPSVSVEGVSTVSICFRASSVPVDASSVPVDAGSVLVDAGSVPVDGVSSLSV